MLGAITSGLKFLAGAVDIAKRFAKRAERQEHREEGARGQREADQKETLKAKDDQLKKAVKRRPGDASKRLRRGDF